MIGREFSYEQIQAISDIEEAELSQELTQLVEAELLYQRGVPPRVVYIFKHALIQDAAYQSLLRRTKQQYHERIANVLEEQFPEICDAQPELLANHYMASASHAKAVVYWQRAARQALERSACTDALAYVDQGLAACANLPETGDRDRHELALQTTRAAAAALIQGVGARDVVKAYARARELCERVGEFTQLFEVLRGLWMYHLCRAELPQSYDLAKEMLELAERPRRANVAGRSMARHCF